MAEPTQPRWKAAFLAPAYGHCLQAGDLLHAALRDLWSPRLLLDRDAAGRYILLDSAADNIERASTSLSDSIDGLVAAELVALRSCGRVPTEPVASVDLLRADADALHDVWLALLRLQSARGHGQDALRRVEAAYVHLRAAQLLISSLPPAAGPDAAMDKVGAAVGEIRDMVGDLKNMIWLVRLATQPPLRIEWR